jgi:hypothetical protein
MARRHDARATREQDASEKQNRKRPSERVFHAMKRCWGSFTATPDHPRSPDPPRRGSFGPSRRFAARVSGASDGSWLEEGDADRR